MKPLERLLPLQQSHNSLLQQSSSVIPIQQNVAEKLLSQQPTDMDTNLEKPPSYPAN